MQSLLMNWKTSSAGAIVVALALFEMLTGVKIPGFSMEPGTAMAVGIGLLMAKDGNVTGAGASAKALGIAVLAFLGLGTAAFAADLAYKAPVLRETAPVCTATNCSGFYVGAGLLGSGTNLDILGSGLNGSVFAAGSDVHAVAGYQFWNGTYFLAIEGIGFYQMNGLTADVGPQGHFGGGALVKAGGLLGNLFGSGSPAPSQAPVGVIQVLQSSLLSPYVAIGPWWRYGHPATAAGAGAEFTLGSGVNLDLSYLHITYNETINPATQAKDENLIKLTVLRKF